MKPTIYGKFNEYKHTHKYAYLRLRVDPKVSTVRFAYENLRTSHNYYHFAPVLIWCCISKVNFWFVYLCYYLFVLVFFSFLSTYLTMFYRLQLEEQSSTLRFACGFDNQLFPRTIISDPMSTPQWTIRLTRLISSTYSAQALLVWLKC